MKLNIPNQKITLTCPSCESTFFSVDENEIATCGTCSLKLHKDELARLKDKAQKQENAQKIVLGGMLLSVARKNNDVARMVLDMISKEVNRDTDKKRLESVIIELQEVVTKAL